MPRSKWILHVTENPYLPSSSTLIVEAQPAGTLRRPTGVSLIAFLFLVVSLARLGTSISFFVMLPGFHLLSIVQLAITFPLLASSVAMFFGRSWGWMFATTLVFLGLLDQILVIGAQLVSRTQSSLGDAAIHLPVVFVFASILYYFHREHVLAYFRVPMDKRYSILAGQFALCLLLRVGLSVLVSWRAVS